jgi:hypothetical protein
MSNDVARAANTLRGQQWGHLQQNSVASRGFRCDAVLAADLARPIKESGQLGGDAGGNRVAGSHSIASQHRNLDSPPDRYANPGHRCLSLAGVVV